MTHSRKGLGALVLTALAAACALLLWPATRAGAEEGAPPPCNGLFATDAAKDEIVVDGGPVREGEDAYLDLTGLYFTYKAGADGKKVLSANIRLRDLQPTVPAESPEGTTTYWVEFDRVNNVDWLEAVYDGSEWSFYFGEVTPVDIPEVGYQSLPTETTGRVTTGPDGVVSIDFPDIPEIKAGAKLAGVWAITDVASETYDIALSGYNFRSDDLGYNDGEQKDYTIADCPASGTAQPTATPTVTPAGTPPATPPSGGQPPAPQQQGGQQNRQTVLPLKAPRSLGSARKAARKRSIALKVSSTQTISKLVVQLKKGSKVIATGRRSSLDGKATIKLALRSRRLKKGKYTLAAAGVVDGQYLRSSRTVKLRK